MKDKLIKFFAVSLACVVFAFYFFYSLYKYIFSKKKEIVKIKSGEDMKNSEILYIDENGKLKRILNINYKVDSNVQLINGKWEIN